MTCYVRPANDTAALLKFFGLQCAGNLQELKCRPRLTLNDGEAVAEATAEITESERPKFITDELCKFLKN
jgi:hypothetical protein